ncbi:C5-sterol desaturase [Athelia psychrophila]|uniref:C5-sterol desaturase n=1 Tax=Athelia psychrophila TaxID=1759441 RepID=A0A166M7L6_9AGAM|nr:C5-sterol desaturase [Fibularhizoctonia sp. CBS 109695]
MDFVLEICDEYAFDKVWAHLVPLSAFAAQNSLPINPALVNASSAIPAVAGGVAASSKWAELVSFLPHPALPVQLATSAVYPSTPGALISAWPRDYVPRQLVSLTLLTLVGIHALYFIFAWLSYKFIFNHDMMRHPRFLKNQVKLEIQTSLKAFPFMTMLTLPWFQGEVMGYSRLYENVDDFGWLYLFVSIPFFFLFTDYGVYWVHRVLHHPLLYKTIHKPHHKWIIPTPFSSHAFHPVDGYLQSVPYHLFIFIFPLHRIVYLSLFVFVNFWSIFIHDSDMITGHPLESIINGPAHHTLHHLYFTVNYGQYFTWADKFGGSYRQPESSLDPALDLKPLESAPTPTQVKAQKSQ